MVLLLTTAVGGFATEMLDGVGVGSAVPSREIVDVIDGVTVAVELTATGAVTAPGAEDGTLSG